VTSSEYRVQTHGEPLRFVPPERHSGLGARRPERPCL